MGIMSEMMNEAIDAGMDNNDLEEETDEEVNKVLNEVLAGKKKTNDFCFCLTVECCFVLGKVGQLPSVIPNHATTIGTADVESEDDEMEQRLQALRS